RVPNRFKNRRIIAILPHGCETETNARVLPSDKLDALPSFPAYKIFCDRHGGPIICEYRFAGIDFEHCCREFPRRMFQPTIDRWAPDETHGIRHWPVMAYAASKYAFRQREFSKYGAESSPAQVRELLDEIRKNARRLSRGACSVSRGLGSP